MAYHTLPQIHHAKQKAWFNPRRRSDRDLAIVWSDALAAADSTCRAAAGRGARPVTKLHTWMMDWRAARRDSEGRSVCERDRICAGACKLDPPYPCKR